MSELLLTILLIIKVLISVSISRYIYLMLAWQKKQASATISTLVSSGVQLYQPSSAGYFSVRLINDDREQG